MLLGILPAGPRPDAVPDGLRHPSAQTIKAFTDATGLDSSLARTILKRGAGISELHDQSSQMLLVLRDELDASSKLTALLVKAAGTDWNPQREAGKSILSKMAHKDVLGVLFSALELIQKTGLGPQFTSPLWSMVDGLLKSKACVKKCASKFPFELMPSPDQPGYHAAVSAWLGVLFLLEPKDLLPPSVPQTGAYFERQASSIYAFAWSLAFYEHGEAKGCLEIASRCINEGVWSLVEDCALNGVSLKALYDLHHRFFSLFDMNKFEQLPQMLQSFAAVLRQDPALPSQFLDNEAYSKALIQLCTDRFPHGLQGSLELFASLSACARGAAMVNAQLSRLPRLCVKSRPVARCIETVTVEDRDEDDEEVSCIRLAVKANMELDLFNVQMVIPEETGGAFADGLYQWTVPLSGWDMLARILSANVECDPSLCQSILRLFTCAFKMLPALAVDLDAFLQRINPLYFDPKGRSLTDRLFSALPLRTVTSELRSSIVECLSVSAVTDMTEERLGSVSAMAHILESRLSTEMTGDDVHFGLVFMKLVRLITPLVLDHEKEGLESSCRAFAHRLLDSPSIDHDTRVRASLLLRRMHIPSNMDLDLLMLALDKDPSEDAVSLMLEVSETEASTTLLQLLSNSSLDAWAMHMVNTRVSPSFVSLLACLLPVTGEHLPVSDAVMLILLQSLYASGRLDETCCVLFALGHGYLAVLKDFIGACDHAAKIKKHITESDVACTDYLCRVQRNLPGTAGFIEMANILSGSVKATWDMLIQILSSAAASPNHALLLDTLAMAISRGEAKGLDIPHLLAKLDSLDFAPISERLPSSQPLLDSFCKLLAILTSRPRLDPCTKKALAALSGQLKSSVIDAAALCALARSTFLCSTGDDPAFTSLVSAITERFEALSSAEFTLWSDDEAFRVWSNFVLLHGHLRLSQEGTSGLLLILRFICAHVAMNPDEHLPASLLLFARLLSSPSLGQACIQYLCFYHIVSDICRILLRISDKRLLPVFLLHETIAEVFMEAGHDRTLIGSLSVNLADRHLWQALQMLAVDERYKTRLTLQLPFHELISDSDQVSTLMAMLLPARVDYLSEASKTANLTLVECAWNILLDPNAGPTPIYQALVALGLLMVPALGINTSVQMAFYHQIEEHKSCLTHIAEGNDTRNQELALALLDLIS